MAEDWRSRTGHYLGCLVSVRMCTCEQSSKEAGEALFLSSSFSPLDFLQSFNFPTASCLQSPYIYEARIPGWQDDSAMSQLRSKRWNATTRSPCTYFLAHLPPNRSCAGSNPWPEFTPILASCEQIKMNILTVISASISLCCLVISTLSCFSDSGNIFLFAFAH